VTKTRAGRQKENATTTPRLAGHASTNLKMLKAHLETAAWIRRLLLPEPEE